MSISYSLAPNPKWLINDLVGRPLGGGYLATFSSLDHTLLNPVFQDPGGVFPWPYVTVPNVGILGILFDENGSQGPFYFKFDSALPNQLYYLEVYDSDGVLQWTIDDFSPGTGGGGNITTAIDLENLVANNVFYRNIGDTTNPTATTFLKLAPGANSGLVQTPSNAGPDICFIKNNTAATDQIRFITFTLGSNALNGDVTPVQYLNYACTNTPAGETKKLIQFPITQGVQNLTNQVMTASIWARVNSGVGTLTLSWLQFFGDGATASPSIITPIQTLTLSNVWQKFTVSANVPNVTGNNLGACGNDGLFLQVNLPLGSACNIDFTKLSLYLGAITPDQDYHTYDMINGVTDTARTGDWRTSLNNFAPYGWVPMNDGTIGDASSNAITRANIDTFPLFDLLWNVSAPYAPMYTSAGVLVARGASSIADFEAHNQISLTKSLGQAISGTSATQIPAQGYTTSSLSTTRLDVSNASELGTGTPVFLTGSPPPGLSISTTYYSTYIDSLGITLATSVGNALAGIPIVFTNTSGSGNIQPVYNSLGFPDQQTIFPGTVVVPTVALQAITYQNVFMKL